MLVTAERAFEALLDDLADAPAFAFDTEFHRETFYYPRLAVLQIAIPGRVAVVDATLVDVAPLQRLLEGPGVFVGHALDQDLEVLDRCCGVIPARTFDTQIAAGFLGFSSASLSTLVRDLLGHTLAKGPRMSDWFKRPLTADQIHYAEEDVAHLLALQAKIVERLDASGRLAWAEDECELHRRLRTSDVNTAWWRLKGARQLKGKNRGIAQAVAAWRERTAMAVDKPARSIVPDEALMALAERPPKSTQDLTRTRVFDPRRLSAAHSEELVEAATLGAELDRGELRLPPSEVLASNLQPLATLITAWVAQQSRDLSIDGTLLATRGDVEAFLRQETNPRLLQGWRGELIGQTASRLATGRAGLAYDGSGSLIVVDL